MQESMIKIRKSKNEIKGVNMIRNKRKKGKKGKDSSNVKRH